MITIIDKNGNKVSSKYNLNDTVANTAYNNTFIYFDSSSNNYILYELIRANKIAVNRYDTSFNLLNQS